MEKWRWRLNKPPIFFRLPESGQPAFCLKQKEQTVFSPKTRFGILFDDANVGIHGGRGRAVHGRSFSFGPIRWGDILGHPVLLPHLIDAIFSTIRFQTRPIFASVQIGIRSRLTRLFGWILSGAQIGGSYQKFALVQILSPQPKILNYIK